MGEWEWEIYKTHPLTDLRKGTMPVAGSWAVNKEVQYLLDRTKFIAALVPAHAHQDKFSMLGTKYTKIFVNAL